MKLENMKPVTSGIPNNTLQITQGDQVIVISMCTVTTNDVYNSKYDGMFATSPTPCEPYLLERVERVGCMRVNDIYVDAWHVHDYNDNGDDAFISYEIDGTYTTIKLDDQNYATLEKFGLLGAYEL